MDTSGNDGAVQPSRPRLAIVGTPSEAAVQALARAGFEPVLAVREPDLLPARMASHAPALVLVAAPRVDAALVAGVRRTLRLRPCAVLLLTEETDGERLAAVLRAGAAELVRAQAPVEEIALRAHLALERARITAAARAQLDQARRRLAERRVIERAKGLLMRQRGLDEEAAYHALRRMAMARGLRLGELARSLLAARDLLA